MANVTARRAQTLHDRLTSAGEWCMWLVRRTADGYTAQAMVADRTGGRTEGDVLTAATLDELRALLPRGLRRSKPSAFWWPGVEEGWD